MQTKLILHFDAVGTGEGYVRQAIGILNGGNARLALAKFEFALDSYLPS